MHPAVYRDDAGSIPVCRANCFEDEVFEDEFDW
jgi:hypothetical protein